MVLCTICSRRSAKKWKLTTNKCEGESKKVWTKKDNGHTLLRSGNIVWCSMCGAFAETRANRLQKVCLRKPPEQYGSGGVRSQLNRRRTGLRPVTRCRLPQTTWADGTAVKMAHGYLRKAVASETVDDKFVEYVADEARTLLTPVGGKSSSEKRRLSMGVYFSRRPVRGEWRRRRGSFLPFARPMNW